jgi:hypothetical protein
LGLVVGAGVLDGSPDFAALGVGGDVAGGGGVGGGGEEEKWGGEGEGEMAETHVESPSVDGEILSLLDCGWWA